MTKGEMTVYKMTGDKIILDKMTGQYDTTQNNK